MSEKDVVSRLKELVSQREERQNLSGGEVFFGWGVLVLTAHIVYNLLWPNMHVWVGAILLGNVGQIVYIFFVRTKGVKTFWGKMLGEFWIFLTLLLIMVFYVFPFIANLYPPKAIYPLTLFVLSIGMFVSGMIAQSLAFRFGAVVFLLASTALAASTDWFFWIFAAAVLAGLVIPGVWSRHEKRK